MANTKPKTIEDLNVKYEEMELSLGGLTAEVSSLNEKFTKMELDISEIRKLLEKRDEPRRPILPPAQCILVRDDVPQTCWEQNFKVEDECVRVSRFINGLKSHLKKGTMMFNPHTLADAQYKAKYLEQWVSGMTFIGSSYVEKSSEKPSKKTLVVDSEMNLLNEAFMQEVKTKGILTPTDCGAPMLLVEKSDMTLVVKPVDSQRNNIFRTSCQIGDHQGCLVIDPVVCGLQTELISGDQNGNIRVWDLTANSCSCELVPEVDTAVRSLTVMWDGSLVVAANNRGTCYVWRLLRGTQTMTNFEPLHKLPAHDGYILKCLLSPEFCEPHRYLATASSDHTVKIWNVDGFTLEKTLIGHQRWHILWVFCDKRITYTTLLWQLLPIQPLDSGQWQLGKQSECTKGIIKQLSAVHSMMERSLLRPEPIEGGLKLRLDLDMDLSIYTAACGYFVEAFIAVMILHKDGDL
ncbi:hypothetical protein IFM89_035973 [Coptis chinensis]|uniref:Target of rapamycin complex subunit LST8 n=1 Tax=Coptis chinensis TaxID=261450 RepID=A0A835LKK1_9MAGN|nr:hypothetical protein IFM89_035973 [Coptis chinensis]